MGKSGSLGTLLSDAEWNEKREGIAMASSLFRRAWLLVLVGVSILTFSPCFLQAAQSTGSGGTETTTQQRAEQRRQQRAAAAEQRGYEKKNRNMHPELQVASPCAKDDEMPEE